MKVIQFYIACLLPVVAGCADEPALSSVPEGTPLTVVAEIGASSAEQPSLTGGVAADNAYDRSTFVATDRIRITRSRGGTSSAAVDYTLSAAGSWAPSSSGSELLFESGATYQAMYPADYSGIYADQRAGSVEGENYRKSNLLRTKAGVTANVSGVLSFTGVDAGGNAFVHQNAKLTLTFEGKNQLTKDFSYMTVQGLGLYSGGSTSEIIYLYRPSASAYTWHGILAPLTGTSPTEAQKTITVSVTDFNGVVYKVTLSCERKANSHYTYTLTLKNNILIPVGEEIKGWENGESHTGTLN